LYYQWQRDGTNLNNGGIVSGATTPALTLTGVSALDATGYACVVTNDISSVTSAVATLSLVIPPGVSSDPSSSTNTTCDTVVFTVSATGSAPSYQWRKNGVNLTNDARFSGVTTASLTNSLVRSIDAGGYDVVLTNLCGSFTSAVATLTVLNPPPTISCPSDVVVSTSPGICAATNVNLGTPTAGDQCGPVTVTNNAPPSYALGNTLVTWTVTDPDGATATCTQQVSVVDTTAPVLACATNKTVDCGSSWDFDPPMAVDVCCGTNVTIAILSTVTNGSNCSLVITRTWQATDCTTNSVTCSQTVTVQPVCEPASITNLVHTGTAFSFDFLSVAGVNYDVEYKDALSDPLWTLLQSVPGTGSTITVTNSPVTTATRFYRVVCTGP
jgi:hypothetical protein